MCWRGRSGQAAVSFKRREAKNAGEPFIKAAVVSSRNSEGHFLPSDGPRVLIIFQKGSEGTRRKSRRRGEVGTPRQAVWNPSEINYCQSSAAILSISPVLVHERVTCIFTPGRRASTCDRFAVSLRPLSVAP